MLKETFISHLFYFVLDVQMVLPETWVLAILVVIVTVQLHLQYNHHFTTITVIDVRLLPPVWSPFQLSLLAIQRIRPSHPFPLMSSTTSMAEAALEQPSCISS